MLFFSHSSRHKTTVKELELHLGPQMKCWLDEYNLHAGVELDREITNAIESAIFFVLFVSSDALTSPWGEEGASVGT